MVRSYLLIYRYFLNVLNAQCKELCDFLTGCMYVPQTSVNQESFILIYSAEVRYF